jgi:murein L,D-transpeptidase YcbB/YkuD
MNFIVGLSKSKAVKLSMFVAKFGGTVYTFDKLYLFVFRDSIFKNESKLDSRTKNELRFMINNLLGYEDAVNEYLIKTTTDVILKAGQSNPEAFKLEVDENPDEYFERALKEFESNPTTETQSQQSVTQTQNVDYNNQEIQKIINKEINPITKKSYVLKRGQQGDGVKQIQYMLNNLKYDYLLNNYGKLESGIDSKFGPYTEEAVKKFQSDNGLKVDGIVGNETLTKLIELTKK